MKVPNIWKEISKRIISPLGHWTLFIKKKVCGRLAKNIKEVGYMESAIRSLRPMRLTDFDYFLLNGIFFRFKFVFSYLICTFAAEFIRS
jgi:hypothetical protein